MSETSEDTITQKLSENVPEGIEILSVVVLNPDIKALDNVINRWEYVIDFDRSMEFVNDRCHELLLKDRIEVTRRRKSQGKALQLVDIRPSIMQLNATDNKIRLTITKPGPLATIPEILALLNIDGNPTRITRTGQWISHQDQIIDPIKANSINQNELPQTTEKE